MSRKIQKHGCSYERLYPIYRSMLERCNNINDKSYFRYGGRGIKVCDEWAEDYLAFRTWAFNNGYDENAPRGQCTIDRIDCDGNYEPSNCRWVDMKTQIHNQHPAYTFMKKPEHASWYGVYGKKKCKYMITIGNKTMGLGGWCKQFGVSRQTVEYRIKTKGMEPYEALMCTKDKRGRRAKNG